MKVDGTEESSVKRERIFASGLSQEEYDEDELDAVEDELGLDLHGADRLLKGTKSLLLKKLNACPEGDFHVSDGSLYSDTRWRLTEDNVVKFDSQVAGVNDLKRSIMFHVLPEFNPWGGARSDNTTHTTGYNFGLLEKYVFSENKLNATETQIAAIDATRLNLALDRAKESGFLTTYRHVYFFVNLWLQLSAQRFIPESQRLKVAANRVITKERQMDIVEHHRRLGGIYKPLDEHQLTTLINYAIFWTERAMPALLEVRDILISQGVDKGYRRILTQKASHAAFLEERLTVVVDGVEVMKPSVNYNERVPKGYDRLYRFWDISWIRPYARALDSVRNAIFVWIAIVTGARKRELAVLTDEDILIDEASGEYSVRITRFKTTADPNFAGVQDIIPLPAFVGEIIRDYVALRDVRNFSKVKSLFGSHNHSRLGKSKSTYNAYIALEGIILSIQDALGLEGVHCHRFRKTIAEILINRDERNIDIIRLLFGHTSYTMTLKYIARNPYLVRGVVQAIEENYTNDLGAIISGLKSGVYAGQRADELAQKLSNREAIFAGKAIRAEIHDYISHLVRSGEPIYIHRTSLGTGTYCLTNDSYANGVKPPCIASRPLAEGSIPNPKNCQVECKNLILLDAAQTALNQNIRFYSNLVASDSLNERMLTAISAKILVAEQRLSELRARAASTEGIVDLSKRALS
ncbi:tyrosine-type recombinase/integrase [Paraburkholderia dilworthii]|uniref:Tyrosine-type recombinase/integrase n=1 Tax=Paraburkholderia dilworthii TaxID=948106 RepID=A0ABW9DET3_9BURK